MYGLTFVAKKVGKVVTIQITGTVTSGITTTDYLDVPFSEVNVSSPFGRLEYNLEHGIMTTRNWESICLSGIKSGDIFTKNDVDGAINHPIFITL